MSEFENITRDNGSQVITERYSEDNIRWLSQLVQDAQLDGKSKYYDIRVNHEIVVPRNTEPEKFNGYLRYVNDTTKVVEVRMYHGASPNCNKYVFLNEESLAGPVSLNDQITKALEEDRLKRDNESLIIENKRLKRKLKKIKLKTGKTSALGQMENIVSGAAKVFSVIKGAAPVNGLPEDDNSEEVQVEVEQEDQADRYYHFIKQQLGVEGTVEMFKIINKLGKNPDLFKQLKAELKRRKKAEKTEKTQSENNQDHEHN